MYLIRIEAAQILVVFLIEDVEFIIDKTGVFFLEDSLEHSLFGCSVLVVTTVFSDFVDKEQRQTLDALFEKLTFSLEVSLDSLADLNALHVQFVCVAYEVAFVECYSVGERNVGSGRSI